MEKSSRYFAIEVAQLSVEDSTAPADDPLDGVKRVRYVRRRFLPNPARLTTVAEHITADGDRLDNLAARYLGDPTLFWRIADANKTLRPDDLTEETGKTLQIALEIGP